MLQALWKQKSSYNLGCVFFTHRLHIKTNYLHCCLADATCSVAREAHMAPLPLEYRLVQYLSYALITIFSSELNDSEINQFLIFPWWPPGTPLIPRLESQKIKLVLIEQVLNAYPRVVRAQRIKRYEDCTAYFDAGAPVSHYSIREVQRGITSILHGQCQLLRCQVKS